eukprot:380051_1
MSEALFDISTTDYFAKEDEILTGLALSVIYGCTHLLLVIILAVYIYISSQKSNDNTSLKNFILDLWKLRGVYSPLLIHIYDTATDIGVLYEWYKLAQIEKS